MSRPTITAAVCTRHRPGEVARCLPAILATDADQILVVDQSTDGDTEALVRDAATDDRRVTYIRSPLIGLSRGRNVALSACTTDLIAFTDDDCTVPSNWTALLRRHMSEHGYDVLFASVVAPDNKDASSWVPEFRPIATGSVGPSPDPIEAFGIGANMCLSISALVAIGLFDEQMGAGSAYIPAGEDTDLAYRAHLVGRSVGIADFPAVVHHGSRAGAERTVLRQAYHRGAAGMLDKHRRLGDRRARRREIIAVLEPLRQATREAIRFRRPSGLRDAVAFVRGVASARLRYRVDPASSLYVPRTPAPGRG